ncbi:hypothetical protein [Dictyobacter formicarum]|uniref:DUF2335 domain-containing protein n=1 Tax=Dictyobacter formicarum TaxID=2778368 RepID=A0ABQ3VAY0_9CHLR|nr:hypothetical protein [Dictyobacter formicarum]GHO82999.1 hypothetical protein KSZ_10050 [Dictyobacter formicarum]
MSVINGKEQQMKDYPDAREHLNRHMDAAARKYAEALVDAGITDPSPSLVNALFNRAFSEAQEDYDRQCITVLEHNIGEIKRESQHQVRQARKKDAPTLLIIFLLVACVFSLMACVSFINHNTILGCIYSAGVAAFALMILGVGIDLLRKD